ncbi:MAG: hypothetical protein AB7U45_14445 [Desulfamplus sp.]
MNDIKDKKSDSSDNLDIVDLDFSDELSGEASDDFIELEDISDGKEFPFDDITDENTSSANLPEELKDIQIVDDEDIVELSDVIKDESTVADKGSNLDEISAVEQEEDDDEIIELVDKVDKEDISLISLEKKTLPLEDQESLSKQAGLIEKESLTLEEPLSLSSENVNVVNVEDKQPSSEKESLLSSEDQIVALLEKVVEDRYGAQLDALFSQVVENILNKQIDNIKKRILTTLQ